MSDQEGEGLVRDVPVWRVGRGARRDTVVTESVVELALNGRVLVRASCLPDALEDFALGFLTTEGLIDGPEAVSELRVSPGRTRVEARAEVNPDRLVAFRERLAISSGCGDGASSAAEAVPRCLSDARFRPGDLSARMKELVGASALFRQTGGVHAAAVTDGRTLQAFAEDLGRHNAVDKAIGRCLRCGIALDRAALLTTGRASADILAKVARVGLSVVVSRGAVTSRAIELARSAGLTAVGFARGHRMNCYTAPWRLGLAE